MLSYLREIPASASSSVSQQNTFFWGKVTFPWGNADDNDHVGEAENLESRSLGS